MKSHPLVSFALAGALFAGLTVPIAAVGRSGDTLREGVRNPSGGGATRETEVIANHDRYATRQSNLGTGGSAIYGCRSAAANEPCVRANNLKDGRAFEFASAGNLGGRITTATAAGVPFETNATGKVVNLQADSVDGSSFGKVHFNKPANTAATEVANAGGLHLAASCTNNTDLTLTASTEKDNSLIHTSLISTGSGGEAGGGDDREDDDFDKGETFDTTFDDSGIGEIAYTGADGVVVLLRLVTEESGFGIAGNCVVAGSIQVLA